VADKAVMKKMADLRDWEPDLLGIYLNDHLAGSTGGLELARRAAGSAPSPAAGETLGRFAREVAEDRAALLALMGTLGVRVRRYKIGAAWVAEKAGRLKPNGHVLQRSPLSSLIELEALRLGVEGKAACWRALSTVAEHDPRISKERLEELLSRARRQAEALEELRVSVVATAFGGERGPGPRPAATRPRAGGAG
jgi:hypothetical protein